MSNHSTATPEPYRLAAIVILCAAVAARAQAQEALQRQPLAEEPPVIEEINVTATRIVREGFTAPTPTTVLTLDDLQLGGLTSLGAVLGNLPEARASQTPITSSGDPSMLGFNLPDLRGLGTTRTLVLVDGQRPVFTSPIGFDMNVIPISLVQRVDVVTGGASAAWGSDAVSGVINIILDKDLEGTRASFQYGKPTQGNGGTQYTASAALGHAFGPDNRGHFVFGIQYNDSADIGPRTTNPALTYGYIANPTFGQPGQPQQLLVPNEQISIASLGGLILGPAPLTGTAFGRGGVPYPFRFGSIVSGPFMSGGDSQGAGLGTTGDIQPAMNTRQGFGRVAYELSDSVKVIGSLLYADSHASAPAMTNYNFGNILIQSGNPFIPASIQSVMSANKIPGFVLSRVDNDFDTIPAGFDTRTRQDNTTTQATIGLEGSFGSSWTWNAYYSYGQNLGEEQLGPEEISDLFAAAADAVTSPATGQPVCRTALSYPSSACVPVNLFGSGSPSAAALRYFLGTPWLRTTLEQNDAAATLQGEPFSLWAGPVSIATGGEFRRESIDSTPDPLSLQNRFALSNFTGESGSYSVKEGFVETVLPLVHSVPLLQELDFNGAVRVSDYSTSGTLTSSKAGLTDQVTGELRLRATISRDIRAPNLAELYTSQTTSYNTILDPATNTSSLVANITGGNPQLQAERGRTVTYGAIYQPTWWPGFRASVDWYDIKIDNAITTLDAQTIVTDCYQGAQAACSLITRSGGAITSVLDAYVNLASEKINGLDGEIAYDLPLDRIWSALKGNLRSHLLLSYIDDNTQATGLVTQSTVGVIVGLPRWRGTLDESYRWSRLTVDAAARVIGQEVASNTISNNSNFISPQTYVDFGLQYALTAGGNWSVYGNILNAFNRGTPPQVATFGGASYDLIGRRFNLGIRYSN